jgi:hypothetical protein
MIWILEHIYTGLQISETASFVRKQLSELDIVTKVIKYYLHNIDQYQELPGKNNGSKLYLHNEESSPGTDKIIGPSDLLSLFDDAIDYEEVVGPENSDLENHISDLGNKSDLEVWSFVNQSELYSEFTDVATSERGNIDIVGVGADNSIGVADDGFG